MNNDNIFLKFLYFLSLKKISDKIFLEGGASLSFIYGFNRVFSQDLDFTIEHKKFLPELMIAVKETMKEIDIFSEFSMDSKENKIIISSDKEIVLSLDVYVLSSDLFLYEEKYLIYDNVNFKIKTHSLIDMFAEKITNLFQKDRCEFKDILDINNIFNRLDESINKDSFTLYLKEKFRGKKIINNDLLFYYKKRKKLEKSFLHYSNSKNINFSKEFFICSKILTNFL